MSQGHCPEELERPFKGQREGLPASLWPRATERDQKCCWDTVPEPGFHPSTHQLHCLATWY